MTCNSCGTIKFDGASVGYKRALGVVIAINAIMFVVEFSAGAIARSQALWADSLDFLADTLTYGISLAVIGMSLRVRATAALIKGFSLALMGVGILGSTLWRVIVSGGIPQAGIVQGIGLMALIANVSSVLILLRYRDGDSNVRSVWLCSRNDAIGNIAVIMSGVAVYLTGRAWPDLLVASSMAGLFLVSSVKIIAQALSERGLAS